MPEIWIKNVVFCQECSFYQSIYYEKKFLKELLIWLTSVQHWAN